MLNQTALFAQVHAALRAAATQFPPESDAVPRVAGIPGKIVNTRYGTRTTDGMPATWETTVIAFGTLKITCPATREGVLRVAEKYHHIPAHLQLAKPPKGRKPLWMNTTRRADADLELMSLEVELAPGVSSCEV